ncbi:MULTISPECIES: hypothetical protein [Chitinophagaceae]
MKNFKMNLQNFENVEILTRSQLRKVLGGLAPGGGSGGGTCQYETPTEFGTTWVDGVNKQDAQNNAGTVSGIHWWL